MKSRNSSVKKNDHDKKQRPSQADGKRDYPQKQEKPLGTANEDIVSAGAQGNNAGHSVRASPSGLSPTGSAPNTSISPYRITAIPTSGSTPALPVSGAAASGQPGVVPRKSKGRDYSALLQSQQSTGFTSASWGTIEQAAAAVGE